MRRIRIAATVVSAAMIAGMITGGSAAWTHHPDRPPAHSSSGVALTKDVQRAYDRFAASTTGRLIQQQGKMATPNVYLADEADRSDRTGATPAKYWYVRNGVHDDGVSLAPEAVLYANLANLKARKKISDFDFKLVVNLGHTDNVNTAEAFTWMDRILAKSATHKKTSSHKPTKGGQWWDVTSYQGGTFTETSAGAVTASSDTGERTVTVTLDGKPFTLTHYWGYYAADPNSEKQKISIYVPQNVKANSPTYFRTNNSGWSSNAFRATVVDGAAYTTGGLAFNTVQGGGTNTPAVIGEVLKRGMIIVDYGARSMNDPATDGEYLGHSPATMTDTKAAIRFLKYNQVYGNLPGDPERVIITGMSGGGGLTTIVAASGNSSDYFASLDEIGALGVTRKGGHYRTDAKVGDDVFATFSSAPIIDLAKADYANEWMYYPTREKVADGDFADATGITSGRNATDYLPEWQNLASAVLGQDQYPAYIRSLGLSVDGVKRTLLDMVEVALERTLNEGKAYRPELVDLTTVHTAAQAKAALDVFLRYGQGNRTPEFAGLPLNWYSVSGKPGRFRVTIKTSAWAAFNEYTYWTAQWVKVPPASDGGNQVADLGKTGFFNETTLWGTRAEPFDHTNPVSWAVDTANWHLFGLTPSTAADTATRQAENRALAASLFVVRP